MIIRVFLLSIFMFCGCHCNSQVKNGYLCDVDTIPLCKFIHLSDGSMSDDMEYIMLNGRHLTARFMGVAFKEGKDSLDCYIKRRYYAPQNYDDTELNQRVIFSILFDTYLNVLEVRQLYPPFGRDQERFKNMFIDIFKGTNGMWIKEVEKYDFYVYTYVTHLF